MLNEGLAQRVRKMEEFQKKINEVTLSVMFMIIYTVGDGLWQLPAFTVAITMVHIVLKLFCRVTI